MPAPMRKSLNRGHRALIGLPQIDEADNAVVAEAIAHFSRGLVDAATANRISIRVERAKLLEAEAPEPSRRRRRRTAATGAMSCRSAP